MELRPVVGTIETLLRALVVPANKSSKYRPMMRRTHTHTHCKYATPALTLSEPKSKHTYSSLAPEPFTNPHAVLSGTFQDSDRELEETRAVLPEMKNPSGVVCWHTPLPIKGSTTKKDPIVFLLTKLRSCHAQ